MRISRIRPEIRTRLETIRIWDLWVRVDANKRLTTAHFFCGLAVIGLYSESP
jgi:hypothetical protein